MPISNRCSHCGSARNAWEYVNGVPYKVKLIAVYDPTTRQTLTLCDRCNRAWVVEKHGDGEATQPRLF